MPTDKLKVLCGYLSVKEPKTRKRNDINEHVVIPKLLWVCQSLSF